MAIFDQKFSIFDQNFVIFDPKFCDIWPKIFNLRRKWRHNCFFWQKKNKKFNYLARGHLRATIFKSNLCSIEILVRKNKIFSPKKFTKIISFTFIESFFSLLKSGRCRKLVKLSNDEDVRPSFRDDHDAQMARASSSGIAKPVFLCLATTASARAHVFWLFCIKRRPPQIIQLNWSQRSSTKNICEAAQLVITSCFDQK